MEVKADISGYFKNNGQLHSLIDGSLKNSIDTHGPITTINRSSAAKRVVAHLKGFILHDTNPQLLRQKGRKEVADYVNKHLHESPACSYKYCFSSKAWQAKLKDWGIEA